MSTFRDSTDDKHNKGVILVNCENMTKVARLLVLSLVIISLFVLPLACKTGDVASYTADEITLLARNASPDCPAPAEGCG